MTTRRTIATVVALLVVGGAAWWKLGGKSAAGPSDLDAAEAALRRNDPAAARPHLDRALAAKPDDAKALLLAARAARRCDDYAAAERHLTSLDSDASRLEWTLLGVQQADLGDDKEQLRSLLNRTHPEEAGVSEAIAKGLATGHRWQEAAAVLERLLTRDPDHVPALILRAAISERFRRWDAATDDLRQAVVVNPDHAAARAALADQLNRHGYTREAIQHYDRALKLRPSDTAARIGLARARADAANLPEAVRLLAETAADDPKYVESRVEYARFLLRLDRTGLADAALSQAMKAAPWNRDAPKLRLLTARQLKNADVAARCEAIIADHIREDADAARMMLKARDNPTDAAVRLSLWEWAKRNGQPDEEVAWLSEILRTDPTHAAAHTAFADYFDRAGQPRRAAQHRAAGGKTR